VTPLTPSIFIKNYPYAPAPYIFGVSVIILYGIFPSYIIPNFSNSFCYLVGLFSGSFFFSAAGGI